MSTNLFINWCCISMRTSQILKRAFWFSFQHTFRWSSKGTFWSHLVHLLKFTFYIAVLTLNKLSWPWRSGSPIERYAMISSPPYICVYIMVREEVERDGWMDVDLIFNIKKWSLITCNYLLFRNVIALSLNYALSIWVYRASLILMLLLYKAWSLMPLKLQIYLGCES